MNNMKYSRSILLLLILLFFTQVLAAWNLNESETEALNWEALSAVEWIFEDGFYHALFNEEQEALDGKTMIVQGYMFPLEYTRRHQTFIVSSAPMGMCFFCGPGEAEGMVYVQTNDPIDYSQRPIKLKGTFGLVRDPSMGVIYELKDAELIR
ncbi:MAG: DUF3299 domain-containing protein [Balneolaceae bacterium]|nr:MAG: DUF3299 domain-containing protein [Balneolaceae bacterium]